MSYLITLLKNGQNLHDRRELKAQGNSQVIEALQNQPSTEALELEIEEAERELQKLNKGVEDIKAVKWQVSEVQKAEIITTMISVNGSVEENGDSGVIIGSLVKEASAMLEIVPSVYGALVSVISGSDNSPSVD